MDEEKKASLRAGGAASGALAAEARGEPGVAAWGEQRGAGLPGRGSPAIRGSMEAGCITSWGRYFRLGMSKNDKRLGK